MTYSISLEDQALKLSEILLPALNQDINSAALQDLSTQSHRSIAELLQDALQFREKVEKLDKLNKLKNANLKNKSLLNLEEKLQIIELLCEILEEDWDLIPISLRKEIYRHFEAVSTTSNTKLVTSFIRSFLRTIKSLCAGTNSNGIKTFDADYSLITYPVYRLMYVVKDKLKLTLDIPLKEILDKKVEDSIQKKVASFGGRFFARKIAYDYLSLKDKKIEIYEIINRYDQLTNISDVYWALTYHFKSKYEEKKQNSTVGSERQPTLRIGKTVEEQIELNKPIMEKLEFWLNQELSEEEIKKNDQQFELLKTILDKNRP